MDKEMLILIMCYIYCDSLLQFTKLSVVQSNSTTALLHFENSMKPMLSVVYTRDYCEIP